MVMVKVKLMDKPCRQRGPSLHLVHSTFHWIHHLNRARLVRIPSLCAVSKLACEIPSNSPCAAIRLYEHAVINTCTNGHHVLDLHLNWRVPVHFCAISKLATTIATSCPYGAILLEEHGVFAPARNFRHPVQHPHRRCRVRIGAISSF